jgi:MFS family permease
VYRPSVSGIESDDYTDGLNPYVRLLRTNRNFRLLFAGQAISQLGDWFNAVAVYALLLDLTGSATSVAGMMIVQFLPAAFVGPFAGVVVDRVDRRRLMIVTDVIRGGVVLGLLLVKRADQIWIAYVVMGLTVGASAFFEPARTATIPSVTTADELLPANALSSAMWSAMLAIGASAGGLVTAVAGRNVAFAANAASFFASAVFIGRTTFSAVPSPRPEDERARSKFGLGDLVEAFHYVRRAPQIAAVMLIKTGWGLAGGVLLLLTVFGQRVFPVGGSTSAGIGVLYGARGIGAGLGPIAVRWILGQQPATLRRSIGPAYFVVAIAYIALSWAPTLALAATCVMLAHFGGSILWVFSTVLLQLEVPERFRGRIFATELGLMTITTSASSYWTAVQLDSAAWPPRMLALVLGGAFCVPGSAWLLVQSRWRRTLEAEPPVTAGNESALPNEEVLEGRMG